MIKVGRDPSCQMEIPEVIFAEVDFMSMRTSVGRLGIQWWSRPRQYSQPQDLMKEVTFLQGLQHPCITKVLEVVEDV